MDPVEDQVVRFFRLPLYRHVSTPMHSPEVKSIQLEQVTRNLLAVGEGVLTPWG